MAEILFARLDELSSAVSNEVTSQVGALTSGLRQTYSNATADADPGAGFFRLNNLTIASATAAYLDNLDKFGNTVSALFDTWDDSTNTTKGTLYLQKLNDPSVWAQFKVTGSVVDGGGYRKLTLSSGISAGSFTDSTVFTMTFQSAGDKGIDGTMSGPGVSVDSEIALFNGISGTVLKRASQTGILKATSGVIGTVGITDTLSILNIELGHASDTTIARVSAGIISVEGKNVVLNDVAAAMTIGTIELGAAADTTLARSSAGHISVEGVTVPLNAITETFIAGTLELGHASDTTLARSSAGHISVEGVTVPLNAITETFTAGTIELGHASDTTLSRSSAGILAVEGVTVALNSITAPAHVAATIELGHASDTTLGRFSAGVLSVEGAALYSGVPITSKSVAYTVVLTDANTAIYHPSTDNNARTFTIDSNANVAFPVGTMLMFINEINTVTIAITSDTLTLQGAGTTGSRTLAPNGVAVAHKVATTKWIISGTGLS